VNGVGVAADLGESAYIIIDERFGAAGLCADFDLHGADSQEKHRSDAEGADIFKENRFLTADSLTLFAAHRERCYILVRKAKCRDILWFCREDFE
jgi:hypothetical protein